MINFDEAVALVRSVATHIGKETVSLGDAAGRVLAAPVVAQLNAPRSDVSAMDGYAVRDEDLGDLPVELMVIGESFAGRGWSGEIGRGHVKEANFPLLPQHQVDGRVQHRAAFRLRNSTVSFEADRAIGKVVDSLEHGPLLVNACVRTPW